MDELRRLITPGARVTGIDTSGPVEIIGIEWIGNTAADITWRTSAGKIKTALLYHSELGRVALAENSKRWSFSAAGDSFLLASEARRMKLAYLFDPYLAVNSSSVEPLPHQIRAVYSSMLDKQPLRFLLADDPGAGKTIMAGLLIKELMLRGDLRRCLIVSPGSLVEQWQDELASKFSVDFEMVTREMVDASRSGNPFKEKNLLLARLDQLARNQELLDRACEEEWDLVVVDEAHKMSAHYFGTKLEKTARYKVGERLGAATRHFLLMTATPHAGKEEDFQLFMALLDTDRFAGRQRDGARSVEVDDMMRRMLKEDLLRFDGTPLFPERRAYTVEYDLSDDEVHLYQNVTDYVREEMNRAEQLGEGEGRRRNTVGFALTILQRRLASSPEAIFQSLRRRLDRLEVRLQEARLNSRAVDIGKSRELTNEDFEDFDDLPDNERELAEEMLVDEASAARTAAELESEIALLRDLVLLAGRVRASGIDKKWSELSGLLSDDPEFRDEFGYRRKVIIFTEHRDTLNYLATKLRQLVGRPESVVTIHGGTRREERKKAQELFSQDKDVVFLVATDAAGEGVNLQRAHLVVNYDLPWNPNRIEQRFGRVHRIGQTEVCHMWNLIAKDTREGEVYHRLLHKLEQERQSLGGRVYDVLGQVFSGDGLRNLLIEAIRYGNRPEVRQRLYEVVNARVGDGLREVLAEQALHADMLGVADVEQIRADMDRAAARKLQPHYVRLFFMDALQKLSGRLVEREEGRYEISHVPAIVRERDRLMGTGVPVLRRYERVSFERNRVMLPGKPLAELLSPGHPLFDAVLDITLELHEKSLQEGAVLISEVDDSESPYLLVYLEHSIEDGRGFTVSRKYQFVRVDRNGDLTGIDGAPYIDLRAVKTDEEEQVQNVLDQDWFDSSMESKVVNHAIGHLVQDHKAVVTSRIQSRVAKTRSKVFERLTREINFWDHRANQLELDEAAGRQLKMNAQAARDRANEFAARLDSRMGELDRESELTVLRPVVVGAAMVVPSGAMDKKQGETDESRASSAIERKRIERLAVDAVLSVENSLGRLPKEMPPNNPGYDIESSLSGGGLLLIEVKGRVEGAETVTITKTEILTALNRGENWVLAMVQIASDDTATIRYLRNPFRGDEIRLPGVTSVNFDWNFFWEVGNEPS